MRRKKEKIIAVFIAYKAEGTLEKFWKDFPKDIFDECILVDDVSGDNTFKIAKGIKGLKAYQNKTNLGYGGNLKRAVSIALSHEADIIVDIHPDGEYLPSAIKPAINKITNDHCLLVLGNRFHKNSPVKNGMYPWKAAIIPILNDVSEAVLKLKIKDYHQGLRVYTKELFERVSFENNSNGYLFSFELIAQAAFFKLKVSDVPVETVYHGKKRGASLINSVKYSLSIFRVLMLYLLAKTGIKVNIFSQPHNNLNTRLKRFLSS